MSYEMSNGRWLSEYPSMGTQPHSRLKRRKRNGCKPHTHLQKAVACLGIGIAC